MKLLTTIVTATLTLVIFGILRLRVLGILRILGARRIVLGPFPRIIDEQSQPLVGNDIHLLKVDTLNIQSAIKVATIPTRIIAKTGRLGACIDSTDAREF